MPNHKLGFISTRLSIHLSLSIVLVLLATPANPRSLAGNSNLPSGDRSNSPLSNGYSWENLSQASLSATMLKTLVAWWERKPNNSNDDFEGEIPGGGQFGDPPPDDFPGEEVIGGGRVRFQPPSDDPIPEQTRGGGTRIRGSQGCMDVSPGETPLTVLSPQRSAKDESGKEIDWFDGFTTDASPTLFFYLPQTTAESLRLTLYDRSSNRLYRSELTLTETPGVVALRLPSEAPPLETGKFYRWKLSAICPEDNVLVGQGWIARKALDLALSNEIASASPLEKAKIYAENGIWFDALKTLADLRFSEPNNPEFLTEWKTLLLTGLITNDIENREAMIENIEAIAEQPIRPLQ